MGCVIIHTEEPLLEAFVPTRLFHREGQLQELKLCLEPLLKNQKANNAYLYGPSGTGKTAIIKWIFKEYFEGISAYVNCWMHSDSNEVLKEILSQLGIKADKDLIKKLEVFAAKKKIVVCLDEVDQLQNPRVLYWLSNTGIGLVLVSNKTPSYFYSLEGRLRSRLPLTEIHFPAYTWQELCDILKDRAEFSFVPESLPRELIETASRLASGDARVGLEILRRAGRKAEARRLKKVTRTEIVEASREARKLRKSPLLCSLNETEKIVYEILSERGRMMSGDWYREYCKRVENAVTERGFRKTLVKLAKCGLVKGEGKGRWRKYEAV